MGVFLMLRYCSGPEVECSQANTYFLDCFDRQSCRRYKYNYHNGSEQVRGTITKLPEERSASTCVKSGRREGVYFDPWRSLPSAAEDAVDEKTSLAQLSLALYLCAHVEN